MKNAVINFKTDEKTKKEAQKVAKQLGISLSMVLNASLKEFVEKKEVTIALEPTPYLEKVLGRAEKDMKDRKNWSPTFTNPKDMDDYLDSL